MAGKVDVHTHSVPVGWPDLNQTVAPHHDWPWLRVDSEREATIMVGSSEFRRIGDSCWAPEVRREAMARSGVSTQVVSPTPVFFNYERHPGEAVKVARVFNNLARETFADQGPEFLTVCQVPLQDADLACAELDRCLPRPGRVSGPCAPLY
ncbi:hypothetical protein CGZ93_09145 [Enemella dayhoffiae]|uniref:2-amino-3-carboxymuconate-6-semialdehyde decarboxylase n=1 Tax=Enemella dayhoffiae TaxID=2016507 RepID=A0A255H372_9ACTN|nr:amidohydrolase family protein [Enemella dayhoffiae]OYO22067.1 hypothetical protein CGZ93_09145 [Enemella dayhoffiae]